MKSRAFLFLSTILVLVFLLAGCGAQDAAPKQPEQALAPESSEEAQQPSGPSATLSEVAGTAQAQASPLTGFESAVNDLHIYLNGQVQTGADGSLRMDFTDGTVVRVEPDTLFSLEEIAADGGELAKKLFMEAGQMWIVLNGGSLTVNTPTGTVSVVGSYLMVEEHDGLLTVTCLEGTCTLEVQGELVVLGAGEKAWFSGSGIETGLMSQEEIQAWLDATPEAYQVLDLVPGTVSDYVWEDLNGNGLQDDDEPGLSGVTVNLYTENGSLLDSVVTDETGFYQFEGVFTGEYWLEFSLEQTLFTVQDAGEDDSRDSDADREGRTAAFNLEPGQHLTDLDAGMVYPGHAGWCPLTGLPTDADLLDNRPIFISMSLFPAWASRPTTGINSAPVVFETLIQDGKTRLQALFYCGYPETTSYSSEGDNTFDISAVRSGRVFYAELAQLFGAGLVFAGADYRVYPVIAPYRCGVVENTRPGSDIGQAGLDIEWLEGIAEGCKHRLGNTDLGVWTFGPPPDGGEPAEKFQINYLWMNQTRWEYDPAAGGYVRYQNDPEAPEEFTLATDRLTGEPVVRQNVILLETPHTILNSTGTIIEFDLTDEGGWAWLLRDGQIHKACWSAMFDDYPEQSNRYRPFLLLDCQTGEQINFAYGSTWVHVVAPSFWFDTEEEYLIANQPFLGYGP